MKVLKAYNYLIESIVENTLCKLNFHFSWQEHSWQVVVVCLEFLFPSYATFVHSLHLMYAFIWVA
jgi:hypothetical protein